MTEQMGLPITRPDSMRKKTKNYQKVILRTKVENFSHKSRNWEGIFTFFIIGHTMEKVIGEVFGAFGKLHRPAYFRMWDFCSKNLWHLPPDAPYRFKASSTWSLKLQPLICKAGIIITSLKSAEWLSYGLNEPSKLCPAKKCFPKMALFAGDQRSKAHGLRWTSHTIWVPWGVWHLQLLSTQCWISGSHF